ncbi:MAG: NAD(P)-dependent oxidoreductase [Cyanobacteria bacterium]|uniref:NAD-dependent epimerase/dehydratase family protein n=1 Tax=Synechococcus sp. CS-1331 TaxID=2847973 RepID=UPI0019B9351A|nr:NAD(P)-dependent oxidoreductase [Synechococcus sp. CS-1331]MCT0226858.1 NAD(P)-dependent oxidoreductase [Synechococcus sp. CS-1331]MDA0887537.1 NAD(P)-dependent oxidoreductase [Cyanobacteriota bacterium]NQW39053.1 NAD(P)-dependent oxidoreductase [Cyanobacteria bacterium bin.275]
MKAAPARILITGASGCVGQHIAAQLYRDTDAELLLLLRDPAKLTAVPANDPRITLLVADLRELTPHAGAIATATRVIHTATAWGDPERAMAVNVVAVKQLLAFTSPEWLEQVIYFSTASLLNRQLELLPEALSEGTEYIQTKALCLQQLEQHPLAERIVAVFPTLVFGGAVDGKGPFPTSYLTAGLGEACRWLWLAKWLRADASFHFIHAADIAQVCCHLATRPHQSNPEPGQGALRRLVLGQPAISVDATVSQLCRWRRSWRPPLGLNLQGALIEALIKLLRIEVNAWDRFSIRQRHFVHEPVSPPERFGLVSHAASLAAVFEQARLPHRGRPGS